MHMKTCERAKSHRDNTRRYLKVLFEACGFARLGDLAAEPVEHWLLRETEKGRSARSRNAFRIALVSFTNWAMRDSRLMSNPFEKLPVANEAADRRPLSTDELARLLYVAERRPLAEYGRKTLPLPPRKCEGRKTWAKVPLTMATLATAYVWYDAGSRRSGAEDGTGTYAA